MNKIIKLVCQFKEERNEEIFYLLIKELNYLFVKYLKKCNSILKEDLYQLFLLELYDNILKFEIDYYIIDKYKFNGGSQIDYFHLPFIDNFIKKIKNNFFSQEEFVSEYIMFANENQFIHLLKRRFKFTLIDFQKSRFYRDTVEKISLNSTNDKNQELINILKEEVKEELNFNMLA